MDNEITTIKLTKKTVQKLAELGKKGDTYEDIILELLRMEDDYGDRKKKV